MNKTNFKSSSEKMIRQENKKHTFNFVWPQESYLLSKLDMLLASLLKYFNKAIVNN